MSANANFIVREVKDCLMMQDAAFDFNPEEKYVDAEAAKQNRPPRAPKHADAPPAGRTSSALPACGKEGSNGKLVPVMVLRGESDGTRSIIKPMPGQSIDENTEFVVAVSIKSADADEKGAKGGNSPFGMKRPERRQRGAGGVEAKPGQNTGEDRRGGPPM